MTEDAPQGKDLNLIQPSAVQKLEAYQDTAESFLDTAKADIIATQESYEMSACLLGELKTFQKRVEEERKKCVGPLNAVVKEINATAKTVSDPLAEAESTIKTKMIAYNRRVQEEERKARVEAERIQAEEQKRIDDAALAESERLREEGKVAEADVALESAPVVPVVLPEEPEKPKAAGISTRKTWDFEIMNLAAINEKFLIVNEKAIRGVVTSLGKGAEDIVGGIRVYQREGIAARAT